MMKPLTSRRLRVAAGAACALALAAADMATAAAETGPRVVELETGSTEGASVRIAEDLASLLDDDATRRLLPVVGKGSLQNIVDLRGLRGIDLAIVQQDVLENAREQKLFPGLEQHVTYVAKLYNEEFHLLARADVKSVEDLAGKKVDVDVRGAGTAFTANRLFGLLGVKVEQSYDEPGLALEKLRHGEIAAIAYVTAKPAPLLREVRPDDHLHLVPIPLKNNVTAAYAPTRLTAQDYPGLVSADAPVDTIAVGTVMLAAGLLPKSERYRNLAEFVDAFFTQFPTLLEPGHHPKWQEVNLAADLPGWHRFAPAEAWLKSNPTNAPVAIATPELKEIFSRFLDERRKLAGGDAMNQKQKDELFGQFERWQNTQPR